MFKTSLQEVKLFTQKLIYSKKVSQPKLKLTTNLKLPVGLLWVSAVQDKSARKQNIILTI